MVGGGGKGESSCGGGNVCDGNSGVKLGRIGAPGTRTEDVAYIDEGKADEWDAGSSGCDFGSPERTPKK